MNKSIFPQRGRSFALRQAFLYTAVPLALAGVHIASTAQAGAPADKTAKPDSAAVATEPGAGLALRNGYAENLQPKVRRPAAVLKQPYQPIKKQDDQALIPEIEMFVGETRVFPTPRVARIAVGNGQLMNAAALDNREVIVFANGVGTSSLFLWNEDGRYQRIKVNIVPGDTTRYSREIAAFLAGIPNAKASVIGDKVIVEGDNLSDLDIAKIEELAKRYPQIVNFTNRLGWEQMVIMDVKVIEFPTNELREIGLKWGATGGAAVGGIWSPIRRGDNSNYAIGLTTGNAAPIRAPDGSSTVVLPSSLHVMSLLNLGLNAQLSLLTQNGTASILAEPQLSARNGAKASFLAGGEYPYTVSTINGPTVIFKPYGIRLDIQPRVDRNGVIRATIESEVSSIDTSIATAAGPAISSRKTNTEFNVRSGETMVLSGLLSRKMSTFIDKVPLLGDIPVLGALFRSKRFQNDETELVVFVTPTVVDSRSAGLVDRVEKTSARLQQDLGQPPFLSNPLQPDRDASRFNEAPPRASNTPSTPALEAPSAPASVPAPGAAPEQGSTLLVVQNFVALRAAPSAASTALMDLPRGAAVRMTAIAPERSGATTWRSVRVGDLQGWVPDLAVVPARLRAAPASSSATPPQDAQVDNSVRAGRAVTADSGTPLERLRVTLPQLELRVSPDVNAPIIARLRDGSVVEALPQAPQSYWQAVVANGKRGWAPAQWLVPAL